MSIDSDIYDLFEIQERMVVNFLDGRGFDPQALQAEILKRIRDRDRRMLLSHCITVGGAFTIVLSLFFSEYLKEGPVDLDLIRTLLGFGILYSTIKLLIQWRFQREDMRLYSTLRRSFKDWRMVDPSRTEETSD